MKKSIISLIPTAVGLLLGCTIIYLLFYQYMTYDKYTINVAGRDYVREITRWAGHKHVVNIPIMRPEDIQSSFLFKTLFVITYQRFKQEFMWSNTTIENNKNIVSPLFSLFPPLFKNTLMSLGRLRRNLGNDGRY